MRAVWALAFVLSSACGDEVRLSRPPTAFGGFDRTVRVGEEVALDASLSADPDGDRLAFTWRIEARPEDATARLDTERGTLVRFVPDVEGIYVVRLSASDEDFTAHDLVTIDARSTTSSATVAPAVLLPEVCVGDLGRWERSACGASPDRVIVRSDAPVEWRVVRVPVGVDTALLSTSSTADSFAFAPPRAGDYWIAAKAPGGPATLAAIGAFDGDAAARPLARIEAPSIAAVGDVVLFDARASEVGTSTSVVRAWRLEASPGANDALTDTATGCPPDRCRRLIPSVRGTYIVSHVIEANGRSGVTAVRAVEVR